jgi:hypothetical protein
MCVTCRARPGEKRSSRTDDDDLDDGWGNAAADRAAQTKNAPHFCVRARSRRALVGTLTIAQPERRGSGMTCAKVSHAVAYKSVVSGPYGI